MQNKNKKRNKSTKRNTQEKTIETTSMLIQQHIINN